MSARANPESELREAARAFVDLYGSPLVRCQGAIEQRLRAALDRTENLPWSAAAQPPITGELNAAGEYRTHRVQILLCEGCLLGKGKECHTPGCAMWLHNSPGMPIHPEVYLIVDRDESP